MSRNRKDYRILNCNLDRSLYERIAKDALENDRTVTAELERILRIYFNEKKEDTKDVDCND